jgi:hypothetical protein
MTYLLYHWHCILPVVAIIAALFFMRDRRTGSADKDYE